MNILVAGASGFIGEYLGTLGSSLVLSAAIRSDINSDYSNGTTFKVGGSYDLPFTNTKARLNYSTAQKNPTFIERFGFFVPDSSATRFEGNPNLKPEKATGWELGLETNFWADQLTFSFTWFREKLENEINGFMMIPIIDTFVIYPLLRKINSIIILIIKIRINQWRFFINHNKLNQSKFIFFIYKPVFKFKFKL